MVKNTDRNKCLLLCVLAVLLFASPCFGNPIADMDRADAAADLKASLLDRYKNNYSTVERLLKAGMRDFDILSEIPGSEVSDGVLIELTDRYYPSFSTILRLYKANMKSYENLQD